jgi:hypothetical protein
MRSFVPQRCCFLVLVLLFGVSGGLLAQNPALTGIGLSADDLVRDTLVSQLDHIFVVAAFQQFPGWPVQGFGQNADSLYRVRLHFYLGDIPHGTPELSIWAPVDSSTIVTDTLLIPNRLYFRFAMPQITNPYVSSVQIELALFSRNALGQLIFSRRQSSFDTVGLTLPVRDSVETRFASFLNFRDAITYPPTLQLPRDNAILGQNFLVNFLQPEDAYPGSLTLTLRNENNQSGEPVHRLYISDLRADSTGKTLRLNSLALFDPAQFDSAQGGNVLTHLADYTLGIFYQDIWGNNVEGDSVRTLRIDTRTERPEITSPADSSTIPRRFEIHYNQPEEAVGGSLTLSFISLDNTGEPNHILYLRNRAAGTNKIVRLDVTALNDPFQIDSIRGNLQLTHRNHYRIVLAYQDIVQNPRTADSLLTIRVDRITELPLLFEPRIGSSTTDSTIRVIYELPEAADTVWLTFAADTGSIVHDTLSPHVLTLIPDVSHAGISAFYLDGRQLGTGSPYIAFNPRGSSDQLKAQCIYQVALTYGDIYGNPSVSTINRNYVWPSDQATIPPTILEPLDQMTQNNNMRVTFSLPEEPFAGSVQLTFICYASAEDTATPHILYLRNIPVGMTTFILDANRLDESSYVDSVGGHGIHADNIRLFTDSYYGVIVSYKDYLGNNRVTSNYNYFYYDIRTEPPVLQTPQDGDTLYRIGITMQYSMIEDAYPGSLKVSLDWLSGPDLDAGSPHVLYLTDRYAGEEKSIILQPTSLAASTGLDSIRGGDQLITRSTYRLTLTYRDTLNNPAASVSATGLVFPSGTIVFVRGTATPNYQVIPGNTRLPAFLLTLHTFGGESILRKLRFWVDGSVDTTDIFAPQVKLWSSTDTIFSEGNDRLVATLGQWRGGEMVFDSFAAIIHEEDSHFILTTAYTIGANPNHRTYLQLRGPTSLDCGGDGIAALGWPIGTADIALAVELLSMQTDQDTAFGALRVSWTVGAENENAGFVLLRRSEGEDSFQPIASYATTPELVGRGTANSPTRYAYLDRGLEPGRRYIYRLAAESRDFHRIEFNIEAEGIPRIPPSTFILGDAYPNPFNQDVTIPFIVPYTAKVEIIIYDLLGRKIRTLVRQVMPPSDHKATWNSRTDDGIPVPSGVYLYRMKAGGTFDKSMKLLLIR